MRSGGGDDRHPHKHIEKDPNHPDPDHKELQQNHDAIASPERDQRAAHQVPILAVAQGVVCLMTNRNIPERDTAVFRLKPKARAPIALVLVTESIQMCGDVEILDRIGKYSGLKHVLNHTYATALLLIIIFIILECPGEGR
jgi:hypothetical protein